jgi:hypothetical protein
MFIYPIIHQREVNKLSPSHFYSDRAPLFIVLCWMDALSGIHHNLELLKRNCFSNKTFLKLKIRVEINFNIVLVSNNL